MALVFTSEHTEKRSYLVEISGAAIMFLSVCFVIVKCVLSSVWKRLDERAALA
jgi:hypothetical protein